MKAAQLCCGAIALCCSAAIADASLPGSGGGAARTTDSHSSGGWVHIDGTLYVLMIPLNHGRAFLDAEAMVKRADRLYRAGGYRTAIAELRRAVPLLARGRDDPDWSIYAYDRMVVYGNLVVIADRAGMLEQARGWLGQFAVEDGDNAAGLRERLPHLPLFDPPMLLR
jgi:hypothetical protein